MSILSPLGAAASGPVVNFSNSPSNTQQPLPAQVAGTTPAVPPVDTSVGAVAGANQQHLQQAVDKVSKVVGLYTNELRFSVDKDTGMEVVKVVDMQTNQVVRQIPSEEMLEIAKNIDKIAGIFVQNKA